MMRIAEALVFCALMDAGFSPLVLKTIIAATQKITNALGLVRIFELVNLALMK